VRIEHNSGVLRCVAVCYSVVQFVQKLAKDLPQKIHSKSPW